MKCPKCNSNSIKKVSIQDDKWKAGDERCIDCLYQANWIEFVTDLNNQQKELFSFIDKKINK